MKYALLTITIFGLLLLMGVYTVANSTEPATIYYTTNGNEVISSIPEWVNSHNDTCRPEQKIFQVYSKMATDGTTCWRYRPWVCVDGGEGVDVEHLPLNFCR
jgi:hypothetical protein